MKLFTSRTPLAGPFFLIVLTATCWGQTDQVTHGSVWQPAQTRVFLVSLTRFKGDRLPSFSTDDRLDDRLAEVFKERGVPASQIVLLKDEQATIQNIKTEFTNLLRQSHPGELLVFYFGSHGSRNVATGDYSFCAFNENVSFPWVFDAIERDFKGSLVFLVPDCCYSGGMDVLVASRKTSIAYACLSSTFANQVAYSGWRFAQCLLRGLTGDPVVDRDNNGHIDLVELADYTTHYMAFAAEGKPIFRTHGRFPSQLRLGKTTRPKSPRQGELLEAKSGKQWAKAEILESRGQQFKIHFTKDTQSKNDAWITQDHLRPFAFTKFASGVPVEVLSSSKWYSTRVSETWESLHLCRYDGWDANYDEWIGPSRIRPLLAGEWSGIWINNFDQTGPETLSLRQDKDDRLDGIWSGNVNLKGERLGNDVFFFEGNSADRFYRCAGRLEGADLHLDYCARRIQDRGHYFGWANLTRKGTVPDAVRDQRDEFAGNWKGTYENSLSNSGDETLTLSEDSDKLQGDWSGVAVTGERLGNATFYLTGKQGLRTYHVIGHAAKGGLVLNYAAIGDKDRYHGRSVLAR